MKKKIARVVTVMSLSIMLVFGLTGCGKVQCDFCMENKKCSKVEFLGEKLNMCKDCEEDLNDFGSLFSE